MEKSLLVKADEKTRARLDEYEKTRVLSEVSLSFQISLLACADDESTDRATRI